MWERQETFNFPSTLLYHFSSLSFLHFLQTHFLFFRFSLSHSCLLLFHFSVLISITRLLLLLFSSLFLHFFLFFFFILQLNDGKRGSVNGTPFFRVLSVKKFMFVLLVKKGKVMRMKRRGRGGKGEGRESAEER